MNEDKFNGKANVYAKYRPTYPTDFIDYLYSEIGLNKNSVIADIGSGTGILTELLLHKDSFVYGVEPNIDMRNSAENALAHYKKFKSINASAENTGLSKNSIDFITVAQAFHWFDRLKFKSECQRIIKNKGKVVLVWNNRDNQSDLVKENDIVNRKFCLNFKGFSGGMREENPEEYNDFFKNGFCEYKVFKHDLLFNEESFIGRNMSASYAPKENDTNYNLYILALKQLYNKYSNSQYLCMPNITRSYVGEV